MILATARDGLRGAWRHKRLALLLWLANLFLALTIAAPFAAVLVNAAGELPLADDAAGELRIGVLSDLLELRPGLLTPFLITAASVAALALLLSCALTGGTLEVLLAEPEGALLRHFSHGAGRYFGRFLRLSLMAGALSLALAAVGGSTAHFLAGSPEESAWEPARLVAALATLAAAGLLALPVLLALDAARIVTVRGDERRMRRVFRQALGHVLRHPIRWIGQWLLFALLAGLLLGLFLLVRLPLAGKTGLALLFLFLAQQLFTLTHAWLRMARFGAQAALLARLEVVDSSDRRHQPISSSVGSSPTRITGTESAFQLPSSGSIVE